MYKIIFYRDRNGNQPVYDYLKELKDKNSKDSRINSNKINDYINILSKHGKNCGEPYIKHIEGELWELRPLKNRIFFIAYVDDTYILLNHFIKKTQKTPIKEIEKAKRIIKEIKERGI